MDYILKIMNIIAATICVLGVFSIIMPIEPLKTLINNCKAARQEKLFHRYCERCQDYNGRKMTTCDRCKYGRCYPKRENNYFRERVK